MPATWFDQFLECSSNKDDFTLLITHFSLVSNLYMSQANKGHYIFNLRGPIVYVQIVVPNEDFYTIWNLPCQLVCSSIVILLQQRLPLAGSHPTLPFIAHLGANLCAPMK